MRKIWICTGKKSKKSKDI